MTCVVADPSQPVAEETAKVVEALEGQVKADYAPPRVKRDAHPKMHGCVLAELRVDKEIAPELRHGILATPDACYRAWIRFSNAFRVTHDLKIDTRGMGIKLLDVAGDRLPGDEADTQDFLLATHSAFFLADHNGYRAFTDAAGKQSLKDLAFFFFSKPQRWRGAWRLIRSMTVLARNPLAIPYFSQTPYRLGPNLVVKLQARPCLTPELADSLPAKWSFGCQVFAASLRLFLGQGVNGTAAAEDFCDRLIANRDFLRLAMMSFLAEHDASFDLLVQRWIDERRTPINDATKRWSESLSPYTKVATIRVPRQVFWPQPGLSKVVEKATNDMLALGENMSFNPWHGLCDHEPLGDINQMRRRVYPAIVTLRNGLNGVAPVVPTSDEYKRLGRIVR